MNKKIILFSELSKGQIFRFLGTHKYYEVVSVGKNRIGFKAIYFENAKIEYLTFKDAGQSQVVLK